MKQSENRSSYFRDVLERFLRHKMAVIGLTIIVVEVLSVLLLPQLLHLNPTRSDFSAGVYAEPSAKHILGTDDISRDLFARVIYGGRTSLYVGVVSALIGLAIGAPLGLIAGYYGKLVGTIIMRQSWSGLASKKSFTCARFFSYWAESKVSGVTLAKYRPSRPSHVPLISSRSAARCTSDDASIHLSRSAIWSAT